MTHNLTLHGCSIAPIGQVRKSTARKVSERHRPLISLRRTSMWDPAATAKVARKVEVVAAAR